MLTSKDLHDAKFDKMMFNGYNAEQVDQLLDEAADTVDTMTAENLLLKDKLKTVTAQLEEYKSNETAIKDAVLSAQRMAGGLVDDARKKSDEIMREATETVKKKIEEYRASIAAEEKRLNDAKRCCADFFEKIYSDFEDEMSTVKAIQNGIKPEPEEEKPAPRKPIDISLTDTDAIPAFAPQQDAPQTPPKKTAEDIFRAVVAGKSIVGEDEPEKKDATHANEFAGLKFGSDYDVSKDEK